VLKIRFSATLFVATCACALSNTAHAAEPLGLYVGASVGNADVRSEDHNLGTIHGFSASALGWQVMAGIRPLPVLGAEISYMDLGNPHVGPVNAPGFIYASSNTRQNAASLFGVGYLSGDRVDLYGKLGVARLHSDATQVSAPVEGAAGPGSPATGSPPLFHENGWNTSVAFGVGMLLRMGSVAARLEYERIQAPGGAPNLIAVGLIESF
jgi:hypothetical protein